MGCYTVYSPARLAITAASRATRGAWVSGHVTLRDGNADAVFRGKSSTLLEMW